MDKASNRIFDRVGALLVLVLVAPLLAAAMLAISLGDRGAPIYRAQRVGADGRIFPMLKLRTMVRDADRIGGRFAPEGDPRITRIGAWLRRFKIDELPQLWNVVRGEMTLVGPRPDTPSGVAAYPIDERRVLAVRPGMTDPASLLFFEEALLLARHADPDGFYLSAIRPVKARLALLYLDSRSLRGDLRILWLTSLSFVARRQALDGLADLLEDIGADADLVALCLPGSQLASLSPSACVERGWSGQMPRVS